MNMQNTSIAIVGMAGRFPGARNVAEFWQNLKNGVEAIRPLSDTELRAAGVSAEELAQPEYVKSGVVLEDLDKFDAAFFGFSPKDASIMDPQHRVFLECAWEALEDAGHAPGSFEGSIAGTELCELAPTPLSRTKAATAGHRIHERLTVLPPQICDAQKSNPQSERKSQ